MAIKNDDRLSNFAEHNVFQTADTPSHHSYLSWPVDRRLRFRNIEVYIQTHPGKSCDIIKLVYDFVNSKKESVPYWRRECQCTNFDELNAALSSSAEAKPFSEVYLIARTDADPLQLIGHRLQIDPRLFNKSPSRKLYVTQARPDSLVFSLPFMDKLKTCATEGWTSTGSSAKSPDALPRWKNTEIRLDFFDRHVSNTVISCGILIFDEKDNGIRDALEIFIKRMDLSVSSGIAGKVGLYNVLTEVFYVLIFTWETFVAEARVELNSVERRCLDKMLSPEEELDYALRLHAFREVIDDGRQCVVQFHEIIGIARNHVFFKSVADEHARFPNYADRAWRSAQNLIADCDQLQVHATRLGALIDAKRAVAEGIKSNIAAASMRRVTFLTFVYLPLMLVASIFGMNVEELVPGGSSVYIWTFIAAAFPVMLLTFLVWGIWAKRTQIRRFLALHLAGRTGKANAEDMV